MPASPTPSVVCLLQDNQRGHDSSTLVILPMIRTIETQSETSQISPAMRFPAFSVSTLPESSPDSDQRHCEMTQERTTIIVETSINFDKTFNPFHGKILNKIHVVQLKDSVNAKRKTTYEPHTIHSQLIQIGRPPIFGEKLLGRPRPCPEVVLSVHMTASAPGANGWRFRPTPPPPPTIAERARSRLRAPRLAAAWCGRLASASPPRAPGRKQLASAPKPHMTHGRVTSPFFFFFFFVGGVTVCWLDLQRKHKRKTTSLRWSNLKNLSGFRGCREVPTISTPFFPFAVRDGPFAHVVPVLAMVAPRSPSSQLHLSRHVSSPGKIHARESTLLHSQVQNYGIGKQNFKSSSAVLFRLRSAQLQQW